VGPTRQLRREREGEGSRGCSRSVGRAAARRGRKEGEEVSWAGPRARGPCSAGRKEKGGGPALVVGQ
jgi:hypothetical protein